MLILSLTPRFTPMPNLKLLPLLVLCASIPPLSGCATSTAAGAVGAERKQLLLVSSEKIEQMAEQGYAKMKTESAEKGVLNEDKKLLNRIRAIGSRIKPHTAIFRPDAPNWQWEINIITSPELNAFCMPGGKIMFYSGLINKLDLSDDEIAIVMGHEIAHALREHSREKISQAIAAQTAISVGTALLGLGGGAADIAGNVYEALIATKFSRTDESEADRIGLELSARAGYDPRAGVTLWNKMLRTNGNSRPPEFISTHPAEQNRVNEIQSLLPVVMPLYESSRTNN